MRIMPFMKRRKGVQFAGIGLDTGGGGGGSLPIASADTLGAVKIGENLNITSEGLLSAEGGGVTISTDETAIGSFLGVPLYSKAIPLSAKPTSDTYEEYFDTTTFNVEPVFGWWVGLYTNGDAETIPLSIKRYGYRGAYLCKLSTTRNDASSSPNSNYFIFIYTKN